MTARQNAFIIIVSLISSLVNGAVPVEAKRAYSSYDPASKADTDAVEIETTAGAKAGFITDWSFLKRCESEKGLPENTIKQAEAGDIPSILNASAMLFHGKGIARDFPLAYKLIRIAAFKGNAIAQNNLGYMIDEGLGTKKDPIEAYKWYKMSAGFGCAVAECNLGYMFETGIGTPADTKEALAWYQKSAIQGNATAKRNQLLLEYAIEQAKLAPPTPIVAIPQLPGSRKSFTTTKLTTPVVFAQKQVVAKAGVVLPPLTSGKTAVTSVTGSVNAKEKDKTASAGTVESTSTSTASADDPYHTGSARLTELLHRMTEGRPELLKSNGDSATASGAGTEVAAKPPVAEQKPVTVPEKVSTPVASKPAVTVPEKAATPVASKPAVSVPEKAATPVASKPAVIVAEKTSSPTITQKVAVVPAAPSIPIQKAPPIVTEKVSASVTEKVSTPVIETAKSKEPPKVGVIGSPEVKVDFGNQKLATPIPISAKQPAKPGTSTAAKVAQTAELGTPIHDKWALIVGVSKFQNPSIPQLQFAAKDATDFYNYLINDAHFAPDHVRLLLDDKASYRRVMSELGSKYLARVAKPDDLVVLYFSTHGSPSQLDLRGTSYVVGYDSDPNDLFATGIEMQKILQSIQSRVLSDRVLLVMDACHSGFAAPNAKGMRRVGNFDAAELAQGSGQMVLCSSEPSEQAWESTRYQNGIFTRSLLKGLKAKGEKTTLVEAYNVVKREVSDEVREDHPGVRQSPVLKGKWNGNDLTLAVKPVAPRAVPATVKLQLEPDSSQDAIVSSTTPLQIATALGSDRSLPTTHAAPTVVAAPAVTVTPTAGGPQLSLSSSYFTVEGNARELVRECSEALAAGSKNPAEIQFTRAKAYIQLNEWNNALADLRDAIQHSPNQPPYYLARAFVYHKLGKTVLARQDIDDARFYDQRLPEKVIFDDKK